MITYKRVKEKGFHFFDKYCQLIDGIPTAYFRIKSINVKAHGWYWDELQEKYIKR